VSLKSLIKERGYKQQQLSERLGVDQGFVSRVINGRQPMPEKMAVELAALLGISVSEIRDMTKKESSVINEESKIVNNESLTVQEYFARIDYSKLSPQQKMLYAYLELVAQSDPEKIKFDPSAIPAMVEATAKR